MRDKKIDTVLYSLIRIIYCITMCSAIIMFAVVEFKVYNGLKIHSWYNYVSLVVAILTLVIIILLFKIGNKYLKFSYCKFVDSKNINRFILVAAIILFIVQIFICYKIYFVTGWDSYIMLSNSWYVANGWIDILENDYFSTYPNNLFLLMIYSWIFKICKVFRFDDINSFYFVIICINCFINSISCYLVYHVLVKIKGKKAGIVGFVFAILLFGLSPWNVVCYSDQWALVFPIGMLALMVSKPSDSKMLIVKYGAIIILATIGLKIKPQIFIFFVAMWIINVISHLRKERRKKLLLDVGLLVATMCCIFFVGKTTDIQMEKYGFQLDKNKNFGIAHYLMMGLNLETNGSYSENDIAYSRMYATKQERNKANIEIAKARFKEYGVKGTLELFLNKLGITYSDGLFSWGTEGNFYYIVPDNADSLSVSLRKIFYNNELGEHNRLYAQIMQVIWGSILVLCLISGIVDNEIKCRKEKNTIYLGIVGVSLYEMIFETRARYIYSYAPLFCVLAITGLWSIKSLICKSKEEERE